MKRNMDLVRDILISVAESPEAFDHMTLELKGDYSESEIHYHLYLMGQAGLLDVKGTGPSDAEPMFYVHAMTWRGHEFLDVIREDTVWNKTKSKVGEQMNTVGFAIIQAVAQNFIKQHLGLPA